MAIIRSFGGNEAKLLVAVLGIRVQLDMRVAEALSVQQFCGDLADAGRCCLDASRATVCNTGFERTLCASATHISSGR